MSKEKTKKKKVPKSSKVQDLTLFLREESFGVNNKKYIPPRVDTPKKEMTIFEKMGFSLDILPSGNKVNLNNTQKFTYRGVIATFHKGRYRRTHEGNIKTIDEIIPFLEVL